MPRTSTLSPKGAPIKIKEGEEVKEKRRIVRETQENREKATIENKKQKETST